MNLQLFVSFHLSLFLKKIKKSLALEYPANPYV